MFTLVCYQFHRVFKANEALDARFLKHKAFLKAYEVPKNKLRTLDSYQQQSRSSFASKHSKDLIQLKLATTPPQCRKKSRTEAVGSYVRSVQV